jgi:uncharacterized protein YbaP (TraB family)
MEPLMRGRLFILGLTLALVSSAAASADRHFLWRVSKGTALMYLVGSVHVMRDSDYPLPLEMEGDFKTSSGLIEEVDLSQLAQEDLQLQMLRRGAYPPGRSLKTALPAELYAKVADVSRKQGLDMASLDSMRPWLVSVMLLEKQLTDAGFDPENGVDLHFASEAERLKKPLTGLEQADYQIGLLADMPENAQQDILRQAVDETANFDDEIKQLLNAWHAGDTATLEQVLKADFGPYPAIYQSMLVTRNRNWAPKLEGMLGSGKQYFVVVGALHLVGPDGLLERFRKDGYKVEQL